MALILALDLGSTTGVCYADREGPGFELEHWNLSGSHGEKGIQLGRRLRSAIRERTPDQVVFEEPIFIPRGREATSLRFGLRMIVQVVCEQEKVPYWGAHVGSIRKHFAGKGNAKKPAVIAEVERRTGRRVTGDEADAFALADYVIHQEVAGI